MKFKENTPWKTSLGHHECKPKKLFYDITKAEELQQIIAEAESNSLTARAVGSGHSFSKVALCDDYLADISGLNFFNVPAFSTKYLPQWQNTKFIEAGGGITIRNLNLKLTENKLALINMGGIDHQTVAGAISTGTHGTGIGLPAFPSMVLSFLLVSTAGKMYRMERTDGFHDKANYTPAYGETLVQDDDTFYSSLVSFGSFGIVHSVILEVKPLYYLREETELTDWNKVRGMLLNKHIFLEQRSLNIRINPYRINGKNNSCLLIRQYDDVTEQDYNNARPNQRRRRVLPEWFSKRSWSDDVLTWLFLLFPKRIPKQIEGSLKQLHDRTGFIGRSHEVLFLGQESLKEQGLDAEFAFSMKNDDYIFAVDDLLKETEKFRERNLFQTAQIGIRFVKGSKFTIASDHGDGESFCFIDTPFWYATRHKGEMLDFFQDFFISRGAKPHWGKVNNRVFDHPAELKGFYDWEKWLKLHDRYNNKGTFSSPFSREVVRVASSSLPLP